MKATINSSFSNVFGSNILRSGSNMPGCELKIIPEELVDNTPMTSTCDSCGTSEYNVSGVIVETPSTSVSTSVSEVMYVKPNKVDAKVLTPIIKGVRSNSVRSNSSHSKKSISSRRRLLDSLALKHRDSFTSFSERPVSGRLDDRFCTSLNRCGDSESLESLRVKRSKFPVVIVEDDDDAEEENIWTLTAERSTHKFLHTPSLHRCVWGAGEDPVTSVSIQNIGHLHYPAPIGNNQVYYFPH